MNTNDKQTFERHGLTWARLMVRQIFDIARKVHATRRAAIAENLKSCGMDAQTTFATLTDFDTQGASVNSLAAAMVQPDVMEMVQLASLRKLNPGKSDDELKSMLDSMVIDGDILNQLFRLSCDICGFTYEEKPKEEPKPEKIPEESLPAYGS